MRRLRNDNHILSRISRFQNAPRVILPDPPPNQGVPPASVQHGCFAHLHFWSHRIGWFCGLTQATEYFFFVFVFFVFLFFFLFLSFLTVNSFQTFIGTRVSYLSIGIPFFAVAGLAACRTYGGSTNPVEVKKNAVRFFREQLFSLSLKLDPCSFI